MKAIKPNFNTNTKNLKIIIGLLLILLLLLLFSLFRDTDTIITHKQANLLFTKNKIKNLSIDGDYIRFHTENHIYKIYKEAINKKAFFEKYPIEVIEDKTYLYDMGIQCW